MKTCPFCAEEILDAAIVCKHCRRDLVTTPAPPATAAPLPKKTSLSRTFIGVLALLIFVGWCTAQWATSPTSSAGPSASTVTAPPRPIATPPPPSDVVALLSARGYQSESGNYWYVEGELKNISAVSLKNVQVVAQWYTKDDTFVTSDSAVVEYNPILPGQTTPFKTITRGNPAMSKFTVTFKSIFGPELSTRDDRKKAAAR